MERVLTTGRKLHPAIIDFIADTASNEQFKRIMYLTSKIFGPEISFQRVIRSSEDHYFGAAQEPEILRIFHSNQNAADKEQLASDTLFEFEKLDPFRRTGQEEDKGKPKELVSENYLEHILMEIDDGARKRIQLAYSNLTRFSYVDTFSLWTIERDLNHIKGRLNKFKTRHKLTKRESEAFISAISTIKTKKAIELKEYSLRLPFDHKVRVNYLIRAIQVGFDIYQAIIVLEKEVNIENFKSFVDFPASWLEEAN